MEPNEEIWAQLASAEKAILEARLCLQAMEDGRPVAVHSEDILKILNQQRIPEGSKFHALLNFARKEFGFNDQRTRELPHHFLHRKYSDMSEGQVKELIGILGLG